MVIREWRGRAIPTDAAGYPEHFRKTVLPQLKRTSGFVGAHLARHELGDKIEFVVLTRWVSIEAVRPFAGADVNKAVLEPEARAALADYDLDVRHYEVLQEA
jgi:heme-degrading monooxygenase HmoA